MQTYEGFSLKTAGGVHAVLTDSVRLFTLGSTSRGIPFKEWEIPCPINDPIDWKIYPCANLIAFVERPPHRCVHYLQESQSQAHSNAATVTYKSGFICGPCQMVDTIPQRNSQQFNTRGQIFLQTISIAGSRLAMLVNLKRGMVLLIWDWKSTQLLFVCQFSRSHSGEISDTSLGVGRGALQLDRVHR